MNFLRNLFAGIKKQEAILTFAVFSLSLIPFLWFHNNQILLGYDNVYPLNASSFLRDRFFSWTSVQGFGLDQSGQQGSLIIHFIDSIPQFFGASIQLSQKIVFSFWFFLLLFAPYIFIIRLEKYGFIKTPYLRYIFPILYAFNFYVLQAWWVVERTKFSLIVATPLILAVIFPMVGTSLSKRKVHINAIICALILTVFNGGGWGGIPLYGGLLLALFCFYIFFSFLFFSRSQLQNIGYLTLFFIFFALWYVLFNAYTLLPFLLITFKDYNSLINSAGGISGLIDWSRYLSENTSFLNLLRLQGIPDLYNNGVNHPYASFYLTKPLFIFASFLFSAFVFLSFLKKKEGLEKIIVGFFTLLFLVALLFSAGTHRPLGVFFEALMKYVPGFFVFRSPIFKFGYVYWAAASFLVGIFASEIIELGVKKLARFMPRFLPTIILPILFISAVLLYYFPYFTGNIFTTSTTTFSSRVTIPSYVNEFSKWWHENGRGDRIMLLPRLNDNWVFEQYTWGYLSLFPILGDFGNKRIVENTDLLSLSEASFVNKLYDAINKDEYEVVDRITGVLGIRYFLVRKDFYHNFNDQITDDPQIVEDALKRNPNIQFVRNFDKWHVYKYNKSNRIIFSKQNPLLSIGGQTVDSTIFGNNSLVLEKDTFPDNTPHFSKIIIFPDCLSCNAERQEANVIIPKPKILVDSDFYDLIELRNRLQEKKNLSVADQSFAFVGETLKLAGQIDELINQDKSENLVAIVAEKYIDTLSKIYHEIPNIIRNTANPYVVSVIIQQYLTVEEKYIDDLLAREIRKDSLVNLEKISFAINEVENEFKKFYSDNNINRNKVYTFSNPSDGEYNLYINKTTTGSLSPLDLEKITYTINDKQYAVKSTVEGNYLNIGKIFLKEGSHKLVIHFSDQKNIITQSYTQNLVGRKNCVSSFANNVIDSKRYSLSFISKNNDPNLKVFIDDGKSFSPRFVASIPTSDNKTVNNRFIISSVKLPLSISSGRIRIAFCSKDLTEDLYNSNISNVSFAELTVPKVILYREEKIAIEKEPIISFAEIDQTHYNTNVSDATTPFYLVLTERFSPFWEANIGKHVIGNGFQNVWLIDKKGNFSIDIIYKPQQFFANGIIISGVFVLLGLFILFWEKRRQ